MVFYTISTSHFRRKKSPLISHLITFQYYNYLLISSKASGIIIGQLSAEKKKGKAIITAMRRENCNCTRKMVTADEDFSGYFSFFFQFYRRQVHFIFKVSEKSC